MSGRMLMLVLLAGCSGGDKEGSGLVQGEDDDGYTSVDTGEVVDTAEDTGTEAPVLEALSLHPSSLVVHPGARFPLRVVGELGGRFVELEVVAESSAPEVVVVDGAEAEALGEGTATLTVVSGELRAEATIEVRDDGLMSVTVLSAEDGSPLEGRKVKLGDDDVPVFTTPEGLALLEVTDGGPVSVSIYGSEVVPTSVVGTVSRELTVLVRTDTASETGTVEGVVDFEGVPEGGTGDITVGIVVPAPEGSPLLVDPEVLTGPMRTVTVFGIEAEVPSNVVIKGHAEDYAVPHPAGPVGLWGLAGAVPIAELTDQLSGAEDALALLQGDREGVAWGYVESGELFAGTTLSMDFAPADPLSYDLSVEVGALPLGFSGDEQALVLATSTGEEGRLQPRGFGLGVDGGVRVDSSVEHVPGDVFMAMAQVGGLGSGGATCLSQGTMDSEGSVVLSDFLEAPEVVGFDPETKAMSLRSDVSASAVRVTITSRDGDERDLWIAGGAVEAALPDPGFTFSYGRTTWELLALAPHHGTFEERLHQGTLAVEVAAADASAACRVRHAP